MRSGSGPDTAALPERDVAGSHAAHALPLAAAHPHASRLAHAARAQADAGNDRLAAFPRLALLRQGPIARSRRRRRRFYVTD